MQDFNGGIKADRLYVVEPFHFAVFRNQGDTVLHSIHGGLDLQFFPVHYYCAFGIPGKAENTLHGFAAAGTDQAGEADDFTFSDLKGNVVYTFLMLFTVIYMFTFEKDFCVFNVIAGIVLIELSANHHCNQLITRCISNHTGADIGSVSENRYTIANLIQFAHLVGYVDNAYALTGQVAHNIEELQHFTVRNGRCRLIHDQYSAVKRNCFDDFNHLLLCNGEIEDFGCSIDSKIKAIEHLLCFRNHFAGIHTEFTHRLTPEENVFSNRHPGDKNKFLMDDGYAVVPGIINAVDCNRFTVNLDFAFFGNVDTAQHFNQCGFPRPIFSEQGVNFAGFQLKFDGL